jgi:hypothetical protein
MMIDALDAQNDEALRALIGRANDILTAREDMRRRETIAEIRRLARSVNVRADITSGTRRRGRRPRKEKTA